VEDVSRGSGENIGSAEEKVGEGEEITVGAAGVKLFFWRV
jgi:hypothetical protein